MLALAGAKYLSELWANFLSFVSCTWSADSQGILPFGLELLDEEHHHRC